MIFIQPLILISELVQHITMLVLVGFMLTECVACYGNFKSLLRQKHDRLRILCAVAIAALWLIIEYFISLENVWYHLFFHVPVVATILLILYPLRKISPVANRIFIVLFTAALLHIGLDVVNIFSHHLSWDRIIRAFAKTVQAFALYFFVLSYTINDKKE